MGVVKEEGRCTRSLYFLIAGGASCCSCCYAGEAGHVLRCHCHEVNSGGITVKHERSGEGRVMRRVTSKL